MSEWVRLAFQKAWHEDRAAGCSRDLREYLLRFPGHERTVIEEFDYSNQIGSGEADSERRVGHYHVIGLLGRGGQATVYLAEDLKLQREVALKVLDYPSPAASQRLMREATLAARLDDPGICKIHEVGMAEGRPFLAMAFVPGKTLGQRLSSAASEGRAAFTSDEVLALVEQLARSLHVAHEAGIVHRDIKPGNVMSTPGGHPVILDFGLARPSQVEEPSITRTDCAPLGTPAYMSPEQIRNQHDLDRTTDVWALGVLLYECLTGRLPFRATSNAELQQAILRDEPRLDDPQLSQGILPVLYRSLAKEPSRRYRTADEMAEDLRRVREGRVPDAQLPGVFARLRGAIRRRPTAAAVAGLLLLGGGFALLQARRAVEREQALRREAQLGFDQLRELVGDLLFEIHGPLSDLPGSAPLQHRLVEEALRYLKLLEGRSDSPELLGEISSAFVKLGDALGHPGNQNLGKVEAALNKYERALGFAERLRAKSPTLSSELLILTARSRILDVLATRAELARVGELISELLEDAETLAAAHPGQPDITVMLFNLHGRAGKVAVDRGQPADAGRHFRRGAEIARDLQRRFPAKLEPRLYLAGALINLGLHEEQAGSAPAAQRHLRSADTILTALGGEFPESVQVWRVQTSARIPLARLLARSGETEEAVRAVRSALRVQRELVRRCGSEPTVQRGLCRCLLSGVDILESLEMEAAVRELLREMPEAATRLGEISPRNARDQALAVQSLLRVTWRWLERGDPIAAEPVFRLLDRRLAACRRLGIELPQAEWFAADSHLLAVAFTSRDHAAASRHLEACRALPCQRAFRADWPADVLLLTALLAQSRGETAVLDACISDLRAWLDERTAAEDPGHRRWIEKALSRLESGPR